jgi:hypothetical protein
MVMLCPILVQGSLEGLKDHDVRGRVTGSGKFRGGSGGERNFSFSLCAVPLYKFCSLILDRG